MPKVPMSLLHEFQRLGFVLSTVDDASLRHQGFWGLGEISPEFDLLDLDHDGSRLSLSELPHWSFCLFEFQVFMSCLVAGMSHCRVRLLSLIGTSPYYCNVGCGGTYCWANSTND
jgi:hypothetical protein